MPDPAGYSIPDDTPTMVIRPARKPDGDKTVKLGYDDIVKRLLDQGYSKAGAAGIARNFLRESQGDPRAVGDEGTSRGLAQWHNDRKEALEAFAKAQGGSADDPDIQFRFLDKEMREKFPTLRTQLVKATDPADAEDAFKRIFERPASVMWGNLGNNRYRFSDYALNEHNGRPDTDVLMMRPQDYLDLSPDLNGDPFKSPSGRSLLKSVNRGDEIESIPSLDMRVNGKTGTVTAQDGRHRALLAQQEGLDAIPVAVRKTGDGEPTEIQGMSGNILPMDFPTAQSMPKSLWSKVAGAIIPSAQAAESGAWGANDTPVSPPPARAQQQAAAPAKAATGAWGADDKPVNADGTEKQEPDGAFMSAVKGAGAGLGRTVLGGQELLGKGLEAVGASGPGEWLTQDARKGLETINKAVGADEKAHPWATLGGEVLGAAPIPGGIAAKIGGNALRVGAIGGAASGLLSPTAGDGADYWANKGIQTGFGAATGAALGKAADVLASWIKPQIQPIYEFVQRMSGQPIANNKGALAVIERIQRDAKVGGPNAQDMIDIANALPDKPLTIADLGGPEIQALTGRVARTPGEGRATMTNFLETRDRGAGVRLAADVDRGLGSGSAYDMAAALRESRAAAAKPLYDEAYNQLPLNPDMMQPNGPIGSILNRPAMRSGMANARKIAAEEGVSMTTLGIDLDAEGNPFFVKVPTWKTLDYVKRGLDDVVETYRDKTTGRLVLDTYGRAADATRTLYRNTVRDLNPAYGKALDSYSGPSMSLDALEAGQRFLSQRPEEIARRLSAFGTGDREFYKLGAADALRTRLAQKAMSADESKALLNSQYMRDQLRPLFDNDDAYHRFLSSVLAERRMFDTTTNALRGSQTAARRAEDMSPELDALGQLARGLSYAKAGHPIGAISNALRAISAWKAARDPKTAKEAADILTTPLASTAARARLADYEAQMQALRNASNNPIPNALANIIRSTAPFASAGGGAASAAIPGMLNSPSKNQ